MVALKQEHLPVPKVVCVWHMHVHICVDAWEGTLRSLCSQGKAECFSAVKLLKAKEWDEEGTEFCCCVMAGHLFWSLLLYSSSLPRELTLQREN